MLRYKTEIDLV